MTGGVWDGLTTEPGLCRTCCHPLLNQTRRGSVFLRCGRAAWDATLPRYPRLPVTACSGYEPGEPAPPRTARPEGDPEPGPSDATGSRPLPRPPGDDP